MKFTVLVLTLALSFRSFSEEKSIAEIIYVKGEVEVQRSDYSLKGVEGIQLLENDIVVTGKEGLAVISYDSDSKVKVDPGSSLLIEELDQKSADRPKQTLGLRIYMMFGSMMMKLVNPDGKKEVEVLNNDVALGVRGTEFFAGVDDEDFFVSVNKGEVEVLNYVQDDKEDVAKGQSLFVEKGSDLTRPMKADWSGKMDWSFKRWKRSGFGGEALRKRRISELRENRRLLRKRKPKRFRHLMRYQIKFKNHQGRKERIRQRLWGVNLKKLQGVEKRERKELQRERQKYNKRKLRGTRSREAKRAKREKLIRRGRQEVERRPHRRK